MKWVTYVAALVALVLSIVAVGFAAGQYAQTARLQSQVATLRSQVTGELAALRAKVSGQSADLITCADLQALGLSTVDNFATVQSDGSVYVNQQPDALPSHCINH